jgi:hypothetical protein
MKSKKEIEKQILEVQKIREIGAEDKLWESKGLAGSGMHMRATGLISVEYNLKKAALDAPNENSSAPDKQLRREVGWPEEFGWDKEGKHYFLADGKEIKLSGFRRKVFSEIVGGCGEWMLVGDMAVKFQCKEGYIRTVVSQIIQRLTPKFGKYLRIEPRRRLGRPGAYRAVSFP